MWAEGWWSNIPAASLEILIPPPKSTPRLETQPPHDSQSWEKKFRAQTEPPSIRVTVTAATCHLSPSPLNLELLMGDSVQSVKSQPSEWTFGSVIDVFQGHIHYHPCSIFILIPNYVLCFYQIPVVIHLIDLDFPTQHPTFTYVV